MTKLSTALRTLIVVGFTLAAAIVTQAQSTRTWVSGVGDDLNPCSRTAPCKTFAGAISKTAINGEIDALDPGGYGTVTITKSITLDGGTGSGWASILASGAAAGIIVSKEVSSAAYKPHRMSIITSPVSAAPRRAIILRAGL